MQAKNCSRRSQGRTTAQHCMITLELSLNNIGKGSTNKHKERKTLNTHDNIFRWLEHLKSLVSNKHQNRQGHCLQETIQIAISFSRLEKENPAMVQGQTTFLLQALKAGREKVAMILYGSFGNIWEEEEVPSYWKKPLRKGIL